MKGCTPIVLGTDDERGGENVELNNWEELRSKLDLARFRSPALLGVVLILVMVAVLAGKSVVDTATAKEFHVSSASESAQADDAATDPQSVFVHVAGCVCNPGLYELSPGARVADAVQAAGGFAEGASTSSVNLARVVADGEQIVVPAELGMDQGAGPSSGGQGVAASSNGVSGLVNINSASSSELESLPGIGASTAQKIIAERTANGGFKSKEDLKRVSGIGYKKYAAIEGLICV